MAKPIKVEITGDSSGYKKALGDAGSASADFAKKTEGHGKLIAGAALGAGAAVGAFAADIIGSASDYNETVSKSKVVFGEASGAVVDFAENAADSFGLSQQAALDAETTFATFGKGAGLAGAELGDFAQDLTGLAADMASFSNTSPEQAIEAIGAALRGEAEPIRAYGVLLDDATLKQAAMELGIYSGNGALTQQQKVMAAQKAIMNQTSDAQGDFARTSDGLAGQQKILAAQFDNLKVTLGQGLIPVAVKAISTILSVGNAFGDLAFGADLSTDAIERFFAAANDQTSIKSMGDVLNEMSVQADKASGAMDRLWSFDDSDWKGVHEVFESLSKESMRDVYNGFVRLRKAAEELDPAAQKLVDDYELTEEHMAELWDAHFKVSAATAETARETDKLSTSMGNSGFLAATAREELQKTSVAMGEAATKAGEAQRNTDNLTASWNTLKGALSDQQAWIDVENSFADVQAAGIEAMDAAKNHTADADQKARDYQSSMIGLKQQVIDYAAEIGGLPPEEVTKILAEIDNGSVTNANQILDSIAKTRQVIYNAQVGGHREYASGTSSAARGLALVGERGPELVVMGGGERVFPASQTAAMMRGGSGITVIVQVQGSVQTERDLVRSITDGIIDARARGEIPAGAL